VFTLALAIILKNDEKKNRKKNWKKNDEKKNRKKNWKRREELVP